MFKHVQTQLYLQDYFYVQKIIYQSDFICVALLIQMHLENCVSRQSAHVKREEQKKDQVRLRHCCHCTVPFVIITSVNTE